jgi:nicotinamidase-related amidase
VSEVIDLSSVARAADDRLLVMVDLQDSRYQELAHDASAEMARTLSNCRRAIAHARAVGMPIVFTRLAGRNRSTGQLRQSGWIRDFEPRRQDIVIDRLHPSCYTNTSFEDAIRRFGGFALAGFMAEAVGVSTAIDAYYRGHRVTFLSDASACLRHNAASSQDVHKLTTTLISFFANPVPTQHWLVATSRNVGQLIWD